MGTLSPADSAYEENLVTIRFATTCKNIKLTAAKDTTHKDDAASALRDEIERLKNELEGVNKFEHDEEEGRLAAEAMKHELEEQMDVAQHRFADMSKDFEALKAEAAKAQAERAKLFKALSIQQMKYQRAVTSGDLDYPLP